MTAVKLKTRTPGERDAYLAGVRNATRAVIGLLESMKDKKRVDLGWLIDRVEWMSGAAASVLGEEKEG